MTLRGRARRTNLAAYWKVTFTSASDEGQLAIFALMPTAELLSKRYRVIVPDLPGSGRSPGRAAEFALRSLRVNGAHSPTWRALVIAQSEAGEIDKASASLRKLLLLDPALTVQSYLARSPAGAPMGARPRR